MRAKGGSIGREALVLLGIWALAVCGCVVGTIHPSGNPDPGSAAQLVDLMRVLTETMLAVVLVLGPGLAIRARRGGSPYSLGFVPLPGLALLVCAGTAAWLLGRIGWRHPLIVSAAVLIPALIWLLLEILRPRADPLLTRGELGALLIIAAALGLAVARSLWSLGPVGELYSGTILRTLEVGDRPDSLTSYHVVQLVTQGESPFGAFSRSYFAPYTFDSRGPLPGIASTPLVLLAGGRPPAVLDALPWVPFDPQGLEAYRVAMMTFAATAFLSVWSVAYRLAGERVARFAVLLAATTPFLVHEVWFTWPKLLAASMVLLAAVLVLDRRSFAAGLMVGVGYLVHPLALFSIAALALIALWPLCGAHLRRPRVRDLIFLVAGLAVCLIGWRVINWEHYHQNEFVNYLTEMGRSHAFLSGHPPPFSLGPWLNDRLVSVANTLVPLRMLFLSANDQSVNTAYQTCFPLCSGGSPTIIHFYFQYWTGVPFGLGIFFFPLLLISFWRALCQWPWAVIATVVIPFLGFAIYWGDASTGMLREGLQAWALTLIVLVAVEQGHHATPWLRNRLAKGILCLRVVETALVAMLPTIATTHEAIVKPFRLTDLVSVATMFGASLVLITLVWRERPFTVTVTDQVRGKPPVNGSVGLVAAGADANASSPGSEPSAGPGGPRSERAG